MKYLLVAAAIVTALGIAASDYAGLPTFAADTVTVTGSVTGSTITVSQMVAAPSPKK